MDEVNELQKTSDVENEIKEKLPLRKIFEHIIKNEKISLDSDLLKHIIQDELKINLSPLPSDLVEALPKLLVYYMKTWPGWAQSSQHLNGTLSLDVWFAKFQEFALFKLKYLIKSGYPKATELLAKENKNDDSVSTADAQTQTIEPTGYKQYSPYFLSIEGPSTLLNSLTFANMNDDVTIKLNNSKCMNDVLTATQLLNWPNIQVEFSSPEVSFRRKINLDTLRYLTDQKDTVGYLKQSFLEKVTVEKDLVKKTYPIELVDVYFKLYVTFLEKAIPVRFDEMKTIINEFLKDLFDLSLVTNNTISTGTTILFNIGRGRYIRQKKTQSTSQDTSSVSFIEVITPKCEIVLKSFTPIRCSVNETSTPILDTNNLKKALLYCDTSSNLTNAESEIIKSFIPSLVYRCTFCNQQFEGSFALNAIYKHFKDGHRTENALICHYCNTHHIITKLSKYRWDHKCSALTNTRIEK